MSVIGISPSGMTYTYSLDGIEIMYGWDGHDGFATFDKFIEDISDVDPLVDIVVNDITTEDGWVKSPEDIVIQVEGTAGIESFGLDEFISARGKLRDSIVTGVCVQFY